MIAPTDYEFLRVLLLKRSGLALGGDKQYLLDGRLAPVMRKHGLASMAELALKLRAPNNQNSRTVGRRGDDHQRVVLLPRQDAVREFHEGHSAEIPGDAHARQDHSHLVRGGFDRAGALFARHPHQGERRQACRMALRDHRDRSFPGSARPCGDRHLQPVRGAARPVDPAPREALHQGRATAGRSRRTFAPWCSSSRSIFSARSPIWAYST